jgi:LCP family protein required for cell wall assembly
MQRINTAYQSGEISSYPGGGPALLKDTIAYNLGVQIDHTAMVEFEGFRRIVDTLGGIEVPIGCAYTDWRLIDPSYDPNNEDNWWLYSVGPGEIHMDGDLALWYARSRSKSSDFDRGRRQQEVLRAILAKGLQADSLGKLPQLYADLSYAVASDLGLDDVLRLGPYALRFSRPNIRGYYIRPPLVSSWITPGGASVQLPNEAELAAMLREATTFSSASAEREVITVEVVNRSDVEGLERLAAVRLGYAGYGTKTSVAAEGGQTDSIIVDFTPQKEPAGRTAILATLGLPLAEQLFGPTGGDGVSYRVFLGSDYQSCFEPAELVR